MQPPSSDRDKLLTTSPSPHDSVARRIVAQARRHFFAFGFRAVTMDDLAKGLGMSKKTLYAHFPSKTALVAAVMKDKARDVENDLKQITSESSSDFMAAMQRLLARMQGHLAEIQPPFLRDMRREAPDLFKIVEIRRSELIHHYFGKLMADGQKSGVIRNDIPTRLIVEIVLAATQAIMNPPKLAELGLTPTEGFSSIVSALFEGLITRTGRSRL